MSQSKNNITDHPNYRYDNALRHRFYTETLGRVNLIAVVNRMFPHYGFKKRRFDLYCDRIEYFDDRDALKGTFSLHNETMTRQYNLRGMSYSEIGFGTSETLLLRFANESDCQRMVSIIYLRLKAPVDYDMKSAAAATSKPADSMPFLVGAYA